MRRQLTGDERVAVKRLIDAHHRHRKGIPSGRVAKSPVGDPTNRYTDAEMRGAVCTAFDSAFEADKEEYFARWDRLASGKGRRVPRVVRFQEVDLGMRRYEVLRDRSSTPSHNTIRRRHGSFYEFVQSALGKE